MNKRFAQILVESIDPASGRLDLAKLYHALSIMPDDPMAVVFDAAGYTGAAAEQLGKRLEIAAKAFESQRIEAGKEAAASAKLLNEATRNLANAVYQAAQGVDVDVIADKATAHLDEKLGAIDLSTERLNQATEAMERAREAARFGQFILPIAFGILIAIAGWGMAQRQAAAKIADKIGELRGTARALAESGVGIDVMPDKEGFLMVIVPRSSTKDAYVSTSGNGVIKTNKR
jgi:hypothetical protein